MSPEKVEVVGKSKPSIIISPAMCVKVHVMDSSSSPSHPLNLESHSTWFVFSPSYNHDSHYIVDSSQARRVRENPTFSSYFSSLPRFEIYSAHISVKLMEHVSFTNLMNVLQQPVSCVCWCCAAVWVCRNVKMKTLQRGGAIAWESGKVGKMMTSRRRVKMWGEKKRAIFSDNKHMWGCAHLVISTLIMI